MKLKFIYFLFFINFSLLLCGEDDLELRILPSDKYKLNNRDLISLKSDIERQLMQRVFEIQSNWDEREKLRHFAISRPPIMPPWPIVSPAYSPDSVSIYGQPSSDANRVDKNVNNNSGHAGYAFMQKNNQMPISDNNESFTNSKEVVNPDSFENLIPVKNSLEKELRKTKNEIINIRNEKYNPHSQHNFNKVSTHQGIKSKMERIDKKYKEIENLNQFLKQHPEILEEKKQPKEKIKNKENQSNEIFTIKQNNPQNNYPNPSNKKELKQNLRRFPIYPPQMKQFNTRINKEVNRRKVNIPKLGNGPILIPNV